MTLRRILRDCLTAVWIVTPVFSSSAEETEIAPQPPMAAIGGISNTSPGNPALAADLANPRPKREGGATMATVETTEPEFIKKLREVAFAKNQVGEFKEPSARVRAAAAQAVHEYENARAAAHAGRPPAPATANVAAAAGQPASAGASVQAVSNVETAASPDDVQQRYLRQRAAEQATEARDPRTAN